MTEQETLQSLEALLEAFLEHAVAAKENRLTVLEGMNRLDDIVAEDTDERLSDSLGNWLAEYNGWLGGQTLRTGDRRRIAQMLDEVRTNREFQTSSPEIEKLKKEIGRWSEQLGQNGAGLVLKRGPETASPTDDPIRKFTLSLDNTNELFSHLAGSKPHLLSVLDESLKVADLQKNRDALLLAGFLLYYLRISGYKTEPYVKRLKEAERQVAGGKTDA